MRKSAVVILFILIVVTLSLAFLFSYSRLKRFTKRAAVTLSGVDGGVPASESAAIEAVKRMFTSGAQPHQYGRFQLISAGDQIFPDDTQIQAHARSDPSLQQYLAMAAASRANDLYLYDPIEDDHSYWYSEYDYDHHPAKFRCNFIIHFEPQGDSKTRIEVLEYLPKLWIGEKFMISGHSGPGFYHDIREVEPTASDRLDLLQALYEAVNNAAGKP